MTDHTKTDGLPGMDAPLVPQVLERARPRNERMATDKIECNACPVLCQISEGRSGACDRYANHQGTLVRVDPVLLLRKTLATDDAAVVPFADRPALNGQASNDVAEPLATDWNGDLLLADEVFVTGVGSSTTYPDYKPAPFIVASCAAGVDMVTVVTEGIFTLKLQ
jgi:6-hydroxynicotinate reductase